MTEPFPKPNLQKLGSLPAVISHFETVQNRDFLWVETQEGFARFNIETFEPEFFDYDVDPDQLRIPSRDGSRLLTKRQNKIELHGTDGKICSARVPAIPDSPYKFSEGSDWEGFFWHGANIWYGGYSESGDPLLYVFDEKSLELKDCVAPKSSLYYPYEGEFKPIERWGDDPRFVAVGDCIGMFSNTGDSFDYFALYAYTDSLEVRSTKALEDAVNCSDEVVWHVAANAKTIVACDDLGLLTTIDLASEKRIADGSPLKPWLDDEKNLRVGGYAGSPSVYDYFVDGLFATDDAVYLAVETDGYNEDFPNQMFMKLEPRTLKPLAVFVPPENEYWDFWPRGFLTQFESELTKIYRW